MTQNNPHLKDVLQQQTVQAPPPRVQARVMAVIQERPRHKPIEQWAIGTVLSLALLALLWGLIQPGIILQWAWKNGDVETFRVYRAMEGSTEFSLLSEIPAQNTEADYKFVDPLLVPGLSYTYQIVGVDHQGNSVFNQMITDSSLAALPGQLAILVVSLVTTIGLIPFVQQINFSSLRKSRIALV
jgi:hypothetical protein